MSAKEDAVRFCARLRRLDRLYGTAENSPLHHDARCEVLGHRSRATLTFNGVTTRTTGRIIVGIPKD